MLRKRCWTGFNRGPRLTAALLTTGAYVTSFVGLAGRLKRQRASQVAGFVAMTIAAVALIGWGASLPLLSRWGAGFATVKPVMALCLAALGLALLHPGKGSRFAFAVGLAVAVFAALGLAVVFFNIELDIDRWLAPGEPSFRTTVASLRVTNAATLALAFAGGSLALSRFERHRLAATLLGCLAGAIALFVLLGYLTGIDTLYGSASVRPPALPTTVCLLSIAGGIVIGIGTMPEFRKPRPLWHLLVMLACAVIAPLLLFGVYTGFSIGDGQFDEVRKELSSKARTLSAQVDRDIIGEIGRLEALAASPALRQGDFAAFQRQAAAALARDQSGNIVLIDRDMHQLANTAMPFGTSIEEAGVLEPAQKALATGKPQVTGLFVGPAKQFMFGIIVPVEIDAESRYALVRSPDPHTLERLVAANEMPPAWHTVVSDAAHRTVAESDHQGAVIGRELPLSQWHRPGPGGLFEFVDSEGRSSLAAYARSELTGWETSVWEPKAVLEAPVRALWWTIGLTALLTLALAVALALWLGRVIARSIGHAARDAIATGEGGPLPPTRTPLAEVNALMAELRETGAKRQAAEDLLRASERQLQLITNSAPAGIVRCDTQLRYKFVNRIYAERHGLTPEQVVGKRITEVVDKKSWATLEPHFRECLAGKRVEFDVEVPYEAREPQFMHVCFEPEWRDGEVVGLVGASVNITGLKRAEAALRDSERQLRLVTDNAPVGIVHCDAQLRYKFINRYHAERLMKRLGPAPAQVIGKRFAEVVGDKVFAIIEPYVRDCLAGNAVEFEVEVPSEVGEPLFLHCNLEPEWSEGKVVGLVSAGSDITTLKRAEAALRESEAAFRAMFDLSSVGKIEVEPASGRFLRANAAMCKFVDYSEAELFSRSVHDITHPDDLALDRELCSRLDAGESEFDVEKRYVRKDGKAVWGRTTVNVIRDDCGRPLRHMAVIQDIDARKQAEEDLKASNDRLQLALDAAQLGSWQYDPLQHVVSGDTRCQEIFDFVEQEAPIDEVFKRVHPDDAQRVREALEASLDPVDPKRSATEFRVWRRDRALRWVETMGRAHFERAGPGRQAVSIAGTVQDITERKEREEKEHLLMREINHRAKNMLSVVDAIAHQTAIKSPEDFIERFSERIQALSANQDLLIRNEWNGVDIHDLVHAQLAHFADLIGSRIAVQGPKLRLRAASAQAIGLALHELATNAGKYGALSTDAGRVDIWWGIVDGTLTISWTEHGGPSVSQPRRRGFGTIVMETMAERSVGGAVDLNYPPSGLTWRLTCPAANALEPREFDHDSGEGKIELANSRSPQFVQPTQAVSAPTEIFAKM
jgi:PAS domain S-box-containing protein